jgi:hypothetical protein
MCDASSHSLPAKTDIRFRERGPVESTRLPASEHTLLNGTSDLRKDAVGVRSNEPNRSDYDDKNYGKHDCVLGDVLSVIIAQQLIENLRHGGPPVTKLDARSALEYKDSWTLVERPKPTLFFQSNQGFVGPGGAVREPVADYHTATGPEGKLISWFPGIERPVATPRTTAGDSRPAGWNRPQMAAIEGESRPHREAKPAFL